MQQFIGERVIDVNQGAYMMLIKSIGHRFPLDINCGSPPNRCTTDIVCNQPHAVEQTIVPAHAGWIQQ